MSVSAAALFPLTPSQAVYGREFKQSRMKKVSVSRIDVEVDVGG